MRQARWDAEPKAAQRHGMFRDSLAGWANDDVLQTKEAREALGARHPAALRVLDVFAAAYGAFAGNMALAALAHGGVYIAGGIAPKIAVKLQDGAFMRAFTAKGRFQSLLATIPVKIVMNDQVGLYGALAQAGRAASGLT